MTPKSRNDELLAWLGFPTAKDRSSDPKWRLLALLRENRYRALAPSDVGQTLSCALVVFESNLGSVSSFQVATVSVLSCEWGPVEPLYEAVAQLPSGELVRFSVAQSSLRVSALSQ